MFNNFLFPMEEVARFLYDSIMRYRYVFVVIKNISKNDWTQPTAEGQTWRERLIKYVDLMTCHIFCDKSEIQCFCHFTSAAFSFIKNLIMSFCYCEKSQQP